MARQVVDHSIEIQLYGTMGKTDNGMSGPHYRSWMEVDEVDVESVYMFGRDWNKKQMIETFGDKGARALINLMCDLADDREWDVEDDYAELDDCYA